MKAPESASESSTLPSAQARGGSDVSRRLTTPITLALVAFLVSPQVLPGADLNWDGECGDTPPQKWHCTCSAPSVGTCNGGGTSNWDNDGIPGTSDNATIAAGSGEVHIDNDVEVASVNAGDGLKLDFYNLRLTGSGSAIKDLRLFSQGTLWVGQTVDLSGASLVQRVVHGPGTIASTGDVDLSIATLRDLVVFRNQGSAEVTTGDLVFGPGGGTLENQGGLTLSSNRDIGGPDGLIINSGNLAYTGPGALAFISPQYVQTSGDLEIQGGELGLQSLLIDLQGGSLTVSSGATLTISSPIGGSPERRFNGLGQVTGGGLLDVNEDMTVSAPVTMNLGQGDPLSGTGGFRFGSVLTLEETLINGTGHRMRFRFGTLEGATGTFINRGEAYTRDLGWAEFRADVINEATFSLLGPGMMLGDDMRFMNEGRFFISDGDISLASGLPGWFQNFGELVLEGADPTIDSNVSAIFHNADTGLVTVNTGILRLQGTVTNLDAGVLTGGRWTVNSGGRLEFSTSISELHDCVVTVIGTGMVPDLNNLQWLTGGAELVLRGGVEMNLGSGLVMTGHVGWVSEDGTRFVSSGGFTLGESPDPDPPEVRSGVFFPFDSDDGAVPEGPVVPASITAPTIENGFGRVLPGDRYSVGGLQLVGDYIQGVEGRLHIDVSSGGADLLSIDGNALLDGKLELNRIDPIQPGTPFTILTVVNGAVTGSFDEIVAADVFSVTYQPQSVTVTFEENLSDIFTDGFETGNTDSWSAVVP